MAVVVTGAAGFIGRALVRALLDGGTPVVGIDRRPQPREPSLNPLTVDLLAPDELVRTALESADAVFHLGGETGVRDDAPDVAARRRRDNPGATAAVLAVVPLRTPVVVTSSSSVYGGSPGERASIETDRLSPRGDYARSKALVEAACWRRLRGGGAVTIARPFTVAGEGQRADMALAQWIAAAREGRRLRVLGSPGRTRDLTDVRHVADALIACVEHDVRGPVNIGTGTGHTLAAMIDAVAEVLGTDLETVVEPAGAQEPPATLADPTRLWRWTGVLPVTDLRDVVARQVAAAPQPAG